MTGLNSRLRTVDVARRAECSVQQVRNLERDGVLPPTTRTEAGYRTWTEAHALAAVAYTALATGVGPIEAKILMRTAHRCPIGDALALLDAPHARLYTERRDVALAREAVAAIAAEPVDNPRPTDAMAISELADALGVLTSTLRHWDREGLLTPKRSSGGGARIYTSADVRDARIVHQLRLAGHRIPTLRALMPVLRHSRRNHDITAALHAREESITVRSRAPSGSTSRPRCNARRPVTRRPATTPTATCCPTRPRRSARRRPGRSSSTTWPWPTYPPGGI